MQSMHFAIDLPGNRQLYQKEGSFSYNQMYQKRMAENPLLVIYVIDKNSKVSTQSRQPRENLFNSDQEKVHVVGLAIAFPKANMTEEERATQRNYYALGGVANVPENDAE